MSIIKGIAIILLTPIKTGEDPFGKPVFKYEEEVVENVLVAPSTADDVVNSTDLTGKKAVYTLAIPKGDSHDWEDRIVRFFGQEWKTFGYPTEGVEENIPLDWNKKVMVERYG